MLAGEFIKQRRNELGITQKEIANAVGVSEGTVSRWESGEINGMRRNRIFMLAQVLKVSPALLLQDDIYDKPFPLNLAPMPKTSKVPRLGSIACGEPILAEQNIEGYDDVPDYVKCDFTLLCKGDSMTGARIYDGDIVCIKQQEEAQNGQIAAVLVDGEFETEATLKRVRLLKDGIALWPENAAYEPWIFTGEDANRVHIIGIATHFISVVK